MNPKDYIISILLINEDCSYSFVGTAFIVNPNGLFISAGHVFKQGSFNKNSFVCAFPSKESEIIKITHLDVLYNEFEYQRKPTFYDFAVGKINKKFDSFLSIDIKRPNLGDKQYVIGYRNYNQDKNKNRFEINSNGILDLSSIQFEELETLVVDRFAKISSNFYDYCIGTVTPDENKFNNCYTLEKHMHKGVSGAPVLNADYTISGVYFGGIKVAKISFALSIKNIRKYIRKTICWGINRT